MSLKFTVWGFVLIFVLPSTAMLSIPHGTQTYKKISFECINKLVHLLKKGHDIPEQTKSDRYTVLGFGDYKEI